MPAPFRARLGWSASPVLALALLAAHSMLRIQNIDSVSSLAGAWVETPASDARSPSDQVANQHSVILPYNAADGYHWIMQTQQMLAAGEPRVRQVDYDNAPQGREVHWASPFRWWLGGVAWLHRLLTGTSIGPSVERGALYANPLLLAVLMTGLTPFVAWRFGAVADGVFALGSVALLPYLSFSAPAIPITTGWSPAAARFACCC